MDNSRLSLENIIQLTLREGEAWAVAHAQRLLELIRLIGADLPYDAEALTCAVYLHDWGAFPRYAVKGVEHALRSRQVVETEILPSLNFSPASQPIILEAIELHDYRDTRAPQSNEALLLREADMLEFIGLIGIAREFARGSKDIAACYRRVLDKRTGIQGRFTLPHAREIAQVRLDRMEKCLRWLEEESFGIL